MEDGVIEKGQYILFPDGMVLWDVGITPLKDFGEPCRVLTKKEVVRHLRGEDIPYSKEQQP